MRSGSSVSPVSSVSPGSSGADVTGTQAQRRAATPARVVVAAAQGVDIDELLEACRVIASSHGGRALEFVAFEPGRVLVGAHAAVLVIDPACAVVDDDELTDRADGLRHQVMVEHVGRRVVDGPTDRDIARVAAAFVVIGDVDGRLCRAIEIVHRR